MPMLLSRGNTRSDDRVQRFSVACAARTLRPSSRYICRHDALYHVQACTEGLGSGSVMKNGKRQGREYNAGEQTLSSNHVDSSMPVHSPASYI